MATKPVSTVVTRWVTDYKFLSEDAYGHQVVTDAPQEAGEPFDGFMPSQLLLASLAACTGIDVVQLLRKQQQQLTGLEIKVKGVQQPEAPWPYEEIHLQFSLKGRDLKPAMVERAIHLSESKYCSVGATIAGRARITTSFQIEEG